VLELAAEDGCATQPWQPVELTIEPFVLAHDVPRGIQKSAEGLGGDGLRIGFRHGLQK